MQAAVDDLCLLVGAPEFDLRGAFDVEVAADVILEYTKGFTAVGPSLLTLVLFVSSLVLFSRVLLSINLSVAYATWSAAGIIATTAASLVIFHDKLSAAGGVGPSQARIVAATSSGRSRISRLVPVIQCEVERKVPLSTADAVC